MADRLAKLHKDMRDHPEKYDYSDVPPARVKLPGNEDYMDDIAPDWVKRSALNRAYRDYLEAVAAARIAMFKAGFKGR